MKIKLGVSVVLAFLAFVFITQNIDPVMVNLLAWSVQMSVALLVFVMLGAGVVIGWLLSSYLRFARNRKEEKPRGKNQTADIAVHKEPEISRQEEKEADE